MKLWQVEPLHLILFPYCDFTFVVRFESPITMTTLTTQVQEFSVPVELVREVLSQVYAPSIRSFLFMNGTGVSGWSSHYYHHVCFFYLYVSYKVSTYCSVPSWPTVCTGHGAIQGLCNKVCRAVTRGFRGSANNMTQNHNI